MSRADRFDSADFDVRYRRETVAAESTEPLTVRSASDVVKPAVTTARKQSTQAVRLIWPIAREQLKRVGESVLAIRKAKERPHKGIDLFADEGTEVLTARGGQVLRVVDGRSSTNKGLRRAGLFVDARCRLAGVSVSASGGSASRSRSVREARHCAGHCGGSAHQRAFG